MSQLLLIIIGLLCAVLFSFAALVYWIRGVQENTDTILASIREDLEQRENRLAIIALRMERELNMRGARREL
jgi:hypothetical protein